MQPSVSTQNKLRVSTPAELMRLWRWAQVKVDSLNHVELEQVNGHESKQHHARNGQIELAWYDCLLERDVQRVHQLRYHVKRIDQRQHMNNCACAEWGVGTDTDNE